MNKTLAESFRNAIELEQKADMLLTASYLEAYSPKKLASFGLAVVNLVMQNMRTGLGGKTLVELALDPAVSRPEEEILPGSLRVGDIVRIDRMANSSEDKTSLEGVITRLSGKALTVSVDEDANDETLLGLYNNTGSDNVRMSVVKLTNSITYKRMMQAMKKLEDLADADKSEVIRLLLGEARYTPRPKKGPWDVFDDSLNESQVSAVDFALSSPIAIIHGPPGTGKTYTLIELIKQLTFNQGERVLVCGASNISVDNILERLSADFGGEKEKKKDTEKKKDREGATEKAKKDRTTDKEKRKEKRAKRENDKNGKRARAKKSTPEKLIRVGHPARLLPCNLQHSLDVLSKSSYGDSGDERSILRDIEKDIGSTLGQIKKCKRYGERRQLWTELKQLKRELRTREKKIVRDLLVNAQVVLATLHGSGSNELFAVSKEFSPAEPFFDTLVIDEVSQSLEPQCWIPLLVHLGIRRLVIAGDNMQLPATVKSREEAMALQHKGLKVADLEYTLFDRLVDKLHGSEYKKLLNVQYRMNEKIMEFPSRTLYNGELRAAAGVRDILLCDLPNVQSTDETSVPCMWLDTQGGDFPEQADDAGANHFSGSGSKLNPGEVAVVQRHVQALVDAGVDAASIGVISPYSAQTALLRKMACMFGPVEVATVDGFQGREKEAIVLSLVRSNDNREVGFLQDRRRLNVAMTRPKRHLCVVGDMALLDACGVRFLSEWARYADSSYDVVYPDAGQV